MRDVSISKHAELAESGSKNLVFLTLIAVRCLDANGAAAFGDLRPRSVHLASRFSKPLPGKRTGRQSHGGVLQLSFKEAIDRGLRNNLGLLLSGDQTITARGERWKELSNLLPNVDARMQENVQTESLAALGLAKIFKPGASPAGSPDIPRCSAPSTILTRVPTSASRSSISRTSRRRGPPMKA